VAVKGNLRCETCGKNLKPRQAAEHHKLGHEVWYIDSRAGEPTRRYGERAPHAFRRRTLPITGEGDEHIREHFKGYQKDEEDIVFILSKDGRIRDMRLEEPLLYPIYTMSRKYLNYKGTFPQFLIDCVETLFATAGYELAMSPKSQRLVYEEVARLKEEGKVVVRYDEEGKLKLEVVQGGQAQLTEGPGTRTGDNSKDAGEKREGKGSSEPQ